MVLSVKGLNYKSLGIYNHSRDGNLPHSFRSSQMAGSTPLSGQAGGQVAKVSPTSINLCVVQHLDDVQHGAGGHNSIPVRHVTMAAT